MYTNEFRAIFSEPGIMQTMAKRVTPMYPLYNIVCRGIKYSPSSHNKNRLQNVSY